MEHGMNEHPKRLHDDETGHSAENTIRHQGDNADIPAQKSNATRRQNYLGAIGRLARKEHKHLARIEEKARALLDRRAREKKVKRRLAAVKRRLRKANSPRDLLLALAAHQETLITTFLTVVSGGIFVLTYSGISMPMTENRAGLIEKGHALSFSLVIAVLSFVGWSAAFSILPQLTGRRLAAGLTAALLFVGSIAAIDAQYNVLGLGGPAAVQLSLIDTARHYEERRSDLLASTMLASQLVPALKTQAARFAALEASEIETGAHSGRQGAGKVSEGFGQVADILGGAAAQVEAGMQAAQALQEEVTAAIAQMKSHAYVVGDVRSRAQAVSEAADRIDALLGEAARYDSRASLAATLASLESLFPTGDPSASGFSATQNAELVAISEMSKPVAASLQDALGKLAPADRAATGLARPLDAMTAVRHYWQQLLPAWIAAIFVDTCPALLLIILIAARREAKRHDRNNEADKL